MNILVASDSFKDALPAEAACRAIAAGIARSYPDSTITRMPLSDGGEGVLEVLRAPLSLRTISMDVMDALSREVRAQYGLSDDGLAVVEMAQASGLQRLALHERDPRKTSTFGTGQMLADALTRGARRRAILGIGGSATNDAGLGMAASLGWRFLDKNGVQVPPNGGHLIHVAQIIPPSGPLFDQLDVLCDVTNPLYGPNGAAFIYGRQKGGDDATLAELDKGLRHIAALVKTQLGHDMATIPGAGAAGGLGFGAMAFAGARLRRGIDVILDLVEFDAAARKADVIITGEGHLDRQSVQGKLIYGLCKRAQGKPVIALAGKLSITPDTITRMGLHGAYSINQEIRPLSEMLAATAENLERTAAALPLPFAR
jgi:glycerate kinase